MLRGDKYLEPRYSANLTIDGYNRAFSTKKRLNVLQRSLIKNATKESLKYSYRPSQVQGTAKRAYGVVAYEEDE
jgi:hypothetical protein